jgi:hypothetical protein
MALTGSLYQRVCYSSSADAVTAYFGDQPAYQTVGTTSYLNMFVNQTGVWKIVQYSISATGVYTTRSTTNATVPTFPTCDPAQGYLDGMTIGWGITLAMVTVFCAVQIRRALA